MGPMTVSYTHLDVYKRQFQSNIDLVFSAYTLQQVLANGLDQWLSTFLSPRPTLKDITPVSYTHLDVYKRQASVSVTKLYLEQLQGLYTLSLIHI